MDLPHLCRSGPCHRVTRSAPRNCIANLTKTRLRPLGSECRSTGSLQGRAEDHSAAATKYLRVLNRLDELRRIGRYTFVFLTRELPLGSPH